MLTVRRYEEQALGCDRQDQIEEGRTMRSMEFCVLGAILTLGSKK